jgi:hypothetical protein
MSQSNDPVQVNLLAGITQDHHQIAASLSTGLKPMHDQFPTNTSPLKLGEDADRSETEAYNRGVSRNK